MRSLFIAIEGIDGSGGTTQTRLLVDWFHQQGVSEVVSTCEPTEGPVGRFIRSALNPADPASRIGDAVFPYLFAADRRDHLDRLIIPALQRGAVVLTDRYYHSSLAYQSLAVGLPAVAHLNQDFRAPDLTLFLDLAPELCLARIQARGDALERFEALDRMRLVYDSYLSVIVHSRSQGERIVRLDATGSPLDVHQRVVAQVRSLVAGRART